MASLTARIARNVATAGAIGVVGDASTQLYEHHERGGSRFDFQYDAARSARLSVYRCAQAPVVDACWRGFDVLVTHVSRTIIAVPSPLAVVAKVALDQALLMPPFVSLFFLSQGYLEGKTLDECRARLRSEFIPTAKTAIPFWCAAHCVTFSLPAAWRIAWASTAAVGWNAILSYRNSRAKLRESRKEEDHDD